MKVGAKVRFIVRDLDSQGAGVGTVAEPIALDVHVPGALPGEEISAHIDSVSTHRPVAWATLGTIHRPSVERVAPVCPAHGRCGGCVLQHYNVDAQARWKEARLRHDVARNPILAGTPVSVIVSSPRALGYRNNAKLVAARNDSGRLVLGAYAPRTHRVVDLAGCAITEPAIEQAATAVRDVLQAHGIQPYDEKRLTGLLRYVILRANATGQVLVTLVTSGDAFPCRDLVVQSLVARAPNVIGVVQNVNPSRGNEIFGSFEHTLHGEPTIEDRIGDVRLRISSRAFFQANRDVANAAYQAITAATRPGPTDRIVDAYAGVGGIALTLAPLAEVVIGIEEHVGAVGDAEASAVLNVTKNARFVAGDVVEHLGELGHADIVILNPPRKGCAPEVLQQAVALGPRVIAYLSCAPDTLLRDLAILAASNYRTTEIRPFDMLPHTSHLEALAILGR